MYLTFGFLYTSVTTNICTFLILALCRQNCTFFKNDRKHSHFVHLGYCHYVTKYLISDMMNYNYLRVLRNRVRRIGKHSPGFSVFRTRVRFSPDADRAVPCSDPEHNTISISHARQVYQRVLRIRSYRWSRKTSILSNYFVNFRRVVSL